MSTYYGVVGCEARSIECGLDGLESRLVARSEHSLRSYAAQITEALERYNPQAIKLYVQTEKVALEAYVSRSSVSRPAGSRRGGAAASSAFYEIFGSCGGPSEHLATTLTVIGAKSSTRHAKWSPSGSAAVLKASSSMAPLHHHARLSELRIRTVAEGTVRAALSSLHSMFVQGMGLQVETTAGSTKPDAVEVLAATRPDGSLAGHCLPAAMLRLLGCAGHGMAEQLERILLLRAAAVASYSAELLGSADLRAALAGELGRTHRLRNRSERMDAIVAYLQGQISKKVACDEQYFGQSELRHAADALCVGVVVLVEARSSDQAFCYVPPSAVRQGKRDSTKIAGMLVLANSRRRHVSPCLWTTAAAAPGAAGPGLVVETPRRTEKDIRSCAARQMARLRCKLEEAKAESGEFEEELDEEDGEEATGAAAGPAAALTGITSESMVLATAISKELLPALESQVPPQIKGQQFRAAATAKTPRVLGPRVAPKSEIAVHAN